MSTPNPSPNPNPAPDPLTIESAGQALRNGTLTSVALTSHVLAAADRLDPMLGTYLARFDEQALAAAAKADEELAAGQDRGPLHGIPIGIKDIITTDEGPTTCQSLVTDPTWHNQGDGPLMGRLRQAGAVICGKTTTMEYAVGRPDPSKPFPVPRNPWDPERWTGGSSSGTGNGVASGQFLGGLGTDTGGSVRFPSALCGITGHKPTFGLVPKSGCFPLGFSYDHIGPMARSAWDCAAMLNHMAGHHPSDRTSVERPSEDYLAALRSGSGSANDQTALPEGLRVGVISNDEIASHSGEATTAALAEVAATLTGLGATVTNVEVPLFSALSEADMLGLQAEAYAYHRDHLIERWDDYGRPTRLTLAMGAFITGGDLMRIERIRQRGRELILHLFDNVDLLLSPTTGYAAQPFSGAPKEAVSIAAMFCPTWNAVGFPALAMPMGFDTDGMPLSAQLIGAPFTDSRCLQVAHAYQQVTDFHLAVAPNHAALEIAA